ncbi:MAG: sodium:proton exchanger [Magnetococcales bacterium]|nr:sodium:proton exchanger [Magnetococcales bacterium]
MSRFIKESVQVLDLISWVLTALFFCGSAVYFGGDLFNSFLGAMGVVLIMFLVGTSVEVIIETMKNVPGIGTLTGFLTNGPEALVVIVGLIGGDILFASSTPLGSNFMNPMLLMIAALLAKRMGAVWKVCPIYFSISMLVTIVLAGGFYLIQEGDYWLWLAILLPTSVLLFFKRPPEANNEQDEDLSIAKIWLWPAAVVLVVSGYFLDPVVGYASDSSQVPKGVIGFVVLSILTSWPEFKSVLALLRRDMALASVLNIVVSNLTNLWLASGGVVIYLLL